jgi:predicted O-methyltransferase YrrM
MIIKDIYIYEKICSGLRKTIFEYITNYLKLSKEDFHNYNETFYISSNINVLIDYNNCFNNKKIYLDNFILMYDNLLQIITDFKKFKTNNILEIHTNDAGHFDSKTSESKYLNLFGDVLKYYNCLNNINYYDKNIQYILLEKTDTYYEKLTHISSPNKTKKKFVSFALSIPNNLNILNPQYENMINLRFSNIITFLNNNLKIGGYVRLFISKFYFSTFNILIQLFKYFEKYKFYTSNKKNLYVIEYRTNVCIFLYNYNGNNIDIDINNYTSNFINDNINDIINVFINNYITEYKFLIEFKNDIINNIHNKKILLNYYITEKINFIKKLNLKINPEYIILFQYKTWKAVLNNYIKNKTVPYNILELGCYEGVSSIWFLSNLMDNPDSKLYCVDTWEGSVEYNNVNFNNVYNKFISNIKIHKNYIRNPKNIIINKSRTDIFLLKINNLNQSLVCNNCLMFDIIFIDASHDSRDVIMDSILSWRLLKVEGILIWDDYIWNKMPAENERPKLAIDSFLLMFEGNYTILSKTTQLIVKKTKEYYFG